MAYSPKNKFDISPTKTIVKLDLFASTERVHELGHHPVFLDLRGQADTGIPLPPHNYSCEFLQSEATDAEIDSKEGIGERDVVFFFQGFDMVWLCLTSNIYRETRGFFVFVPIKYGPNEETSLATLVEILPQCGLPFLYPLAKLA